MFKITIRNDKGFALTEFFVLWGLQGSLDFVGPVVVGLGADLEAVQHGGQLVQGVAISQTVTGSITLTQIVHMVDTDQLICKKYIIIIMMLPP